MGCCLLAAAERTTLISLLHDAIYQCSISTGVGIPRSNDQPHLPNIGTQIRQCSEIRRRSGRCAIRCGMCLWNEPRIRGPFLFGIGNLPEETVIGLPFGM